MSPAALAVRLAREDDNDELLELARHCPMDGRVAIRTERDPRFFALTELQGDPSLVIVAEDASGRLVGCGAAAVRDVYVGGRPVRCAYVGDLRIAPHARGGVLLARLHRAVMDLVEPLGVDLAYCAIVEGNRPAEALREPRRSIPQYRRLGRIRVCAITHAPRPRARGGIEPPGMDDLPEIARSLDAFAARHDLAPAWTAGLLAVQLARVPGLSLERFLVARDRGRIVGVLAAWDQAALQRRRILAYRGRAAISRLLHDMRAAARGRPRLPRAGEILRELHITHVGVEDDRAEVFASLVAEAWSRFADGYHLMSFGLVEGHPLLAGLARTEHASFFTALHAIAHADGRWARYRFGPLLHHEISHL